MRKFFTGVAKFFAATFAILFVITAVLALILFNMVGQLFKANLYKSAFSDLNVYETLPGLVGRILTSDIPINPCNENPIVCEDISPELRACYEQALGSERYVTLAGNQDQPTEAEKQHIQSCLDQYGESTTAGNEENKLQTASPEVQDCVRQAVGEPAYDEIYNNQRPPTEVEQQQVETCFGNTGSGDPASDGGMPAFFQILTAEDWEAILKIIIPPDEMKLMTESVLDDGFAYLDGDVDQVTISLVALKNRLTGPAGADLITEIVTSQPPCTLEDLVQIIAGSNSEGMIICNPPEEMLSIAVSILQLQMNDVVEQLPDQAVILKPYTPDPSSPGGGPFDNDPIAAIRLIRLIMRLTPLLPLIFLLLITLFGVRSPKGWMRWWGIPFFFAGAIALGMGLAAAPVLTWAWNTFIEPRIPVFLTADVANLGREFAQYLAHGLTERIALQALILLVIGLAAWIGSSFIKTKAGQEDPPAPVSPVP